MDKSLYAGIIYAKNVDNSATETNPPKNLNKNINQQQETFYNNTTNNNNSQHKSSGTIKDKGEYVDFEEIKE